jgi:hypothetical protein
MQFVSIIMAIIAFGITWMISEFFIPPRDHWTKSAYSVVVAKIGMASTAATLTYLYSDIVVKLL